MQSASNLNAGMQKPFNSSTSCGEPRSVYTITHEFASACPVPKSAVCASHSVKRYRAFNSMINQICVRPGVVIVMKRGDGLKFNGDQMPTGRVVLGTFAKACEVAPTPETSNQRRSAPIGPINFVTASNRQRDEPARRVANSPCCIPTYSTHAPSVCPEQASLYDDSAGLVGSSLNVR
ncbi:hypothetical protein PILCRDRAFT_669098 [Piloderma croceum F 1598]|uniref:Uncharacterized protein n=1 Tax=Piloderma croceum (strain F 1598) TaxID=765440 RepID=A0A0C3F760_PILCF|nr:hypothetical protein PILCRDRAFT_669098 [Piloderma croceum F 1598]